MNHGESAKAIDVLKAGEPYDRGTTDIHFTRGRAYLLNHQPAQAAQEVQAAFLHNRPDCRFVACWQI